MEIDRRAQRPLGGGDAGDVVDVGMREKNMTNDQRVALRERQERIHFVAGIDQDGFARLLAAKDEAVLEKRANCLSVNYHRSVILAVVDDLMFTSKIKNAAGQLGVPLAFARSSGSALEQMRQTAPSCPPSSPTSSTGRGKRASTT